MEPAVTVLRLESHAKVNLGLEVLGLRQDGYHELRTLFQSLELHDDLELRARRDGRVTLRCDHPAVPLDEENLAVRAARELQRLAGEKRGVDIRLVKRIPVAGGMGGGSSNAATTLIGLDRLWKLGLGPDGLQPLARRLGADVPYFLVGGTALGLARGDEIYPVLPQLRAHLVVVDPERPLSTPAVFRRLDASLTPRENGTSIFRFLSSHLAGRPAFGALVNELEAAALEEAPDLRDKVAAIRGILRSAGASLLSMSGSGATYFGLFDDAAGAVAGQAALEAAGFKAYRTRTVSLDRYRRGAWAPAEARRRGALRKD